MSFRGSGNLEFSFHALERMADRGIPREVAILAANSGTTIPGRNGSIHRRIEPAQTRGFPDLDRWLGLTVVIVIDSGVVATVYQDEGYLRRKRMGRNRRESMA